MQEISPQDADGLGQQERGNAFNQAQLSARPGALPFREELETAYGANLKGLRVDLGSPWGRAWLDQIHADAAAQGEVLVFRDTSPPKDLVAHEVAHALQARGHSPVGGASSPGDTAERDADAAAASALQGQPAQVKAAPTGAVQGAWWRDDPDGDREERGVLDRVLGVGIGVGEGLSDMATGLKDLAVGAWNVTGGWLTDPEQARTSTDTLVSTVKLIADQPSLLIDAVTQPVREDWQAGRHGEAIGRVLVEVLGAVVGAKGLNKLGGASKLDDLADVSKLDKLVDAGKLDELVDAGKLDELADGPPVTKGLEAGDGAKVDSPPGTKGVKGGEEFKNLSIDDGKQGKHLEGSKNFDPGRSRLTADPKKLLERAGTGEQVGPIKPPAPGSKERIDFGEVIGEYVDPKTGLSSPSTKGIIAYAKNGKAHIWPVRP